MWLVALNYAPESSRAVRERQMGTERNQDRDRGALGSREVHIHFREDDVRKPLRTGLHPGSIGPGSPAPCGHAAFLLTALQRLPRVIRKPSQLSLPSAPSHLSKLIYYPFPLYAFLQPLGPSVLSKCNYLVPSFGFCTSCRCVCSQHSPPYPASSNRIRTFFPYCHSLFA